MTAAELKKVVERINDNSIGTKGPTQEEKHGRKETLLYLLFLW